MGDPRRIHKSFLTPMHPWQRERLEEESQLRREYGLKNKHEIWKQNAIIKAILDNYKKTARTAQAQKERQQLLDRMMRLGLIRKDAESDDILGLGVRDILERRLQTVVFKKRLARSIKQARQFIVHRHIMVNGTVVTSPAYIVPLDEQAKIEFVGRSALANEDHPERAHPEREEAEAVKPNKKEKPKAEESSKEEPEAEKEE